MKLLLIAASSFLLVAGVSPGHASCRVAVAASVEVSGEFSLADLLGSSGCPGMRRAAAKVLLGGAPLAGSERVLAGSEVRTTLQKLATRLWDAGESVSILVPERITVRRAGGRASCADIARKIPRASAAAVECGATDRIPENASFAFSRPAWDPALGSWQLYARCVHRADCVPFVVRLSGHENSREDTATAAGELRGTMTPAMARSTIAPITPARITPARITMTGITMARLAADSSLSSGLAASGSDRALPLVRAGQTVTLLWDQDGIRLVVPAVCLDRGAPGEKVRARMGRGGAVVDAIVVSAGMLRAAS
jgi:hypothetical protein